MRIRISKLCSCYSVLAQLCVIFKMLYPNNYHQNNLGVFSVKYQVFLCFFLLFLLFFMNISMVSASVQFWYSNRTNIHWCRVDGCCKTRHWEAYAKVSHFICLGCQVKMCLELFSFSCQMLIIEFFVICSQFSYGETLYSSIFLIKKNALFVD